AGEQVRSWKVNFTAQSVNGGPDGSVFVAGDGKIAKFDKAGTPVAEVELPHLAALVKDQDGLRKQAKEQMEQEIQSYEQMAKNFKDQRDRLTKKDTDGTLTANEKAQLRNLDMNIKAYEQFAEQK